MRINCLQKSIENIGHKLNENGLHTFTKYIDTIKKAVVSDKKILIKLFLGLITFTYYTRFILNTANILKLLYMFLHDENIWKRTSKCD